MLKIAAKTNLDRFHKLWLKFAIMTRDDNDDICVHDVSSACQRRYSGLDVYYARAFFPTFGLEWQTGMTREEGMQKIYYSQREDTTRMIFSFGQHRLKVRPAWAPSSMNGLERVTTPVMLLQERGDLFTTKILSIESQTKRFERTNLNLSVENG